MDEIENKVSVTLEKKEFDIIKGKNLRDYRIKIYLKVKKIQ
jgi:hypothetical protein